jgi:hypothetical protein
MRTSFGICKDTMSLKSYLLLVLLVAVETVLMLQPVTLNNIYLVLFTLFFFLLAFVYVNHEDVSV